jgi:hypothetical protein
MGFIWSQNRHHKIHMTLKRSGICCLQWADVQKKLKIKQMRLVGVNIKEILK